jgi:phosphohistidine phosphatase
MRESARGLRRMLPELESIWTSPLLRARQTAEIVAAAYGETPITESAALAPGAGPEAVAAALREQPAPRGALALVGHEPDLSQLSSWLCAGVSRSVLEFKKGAACLLALDQGVGVARARLCWALPPRALRRIR